MMKLTLRQRLATAIGWLTDRIGCRVDPISPWLYLALRRALIPMFGWALIAIFLFVVPQSREVLHGLSEPPLKSILDWNDHTLQQVNVWALTSYIVTAIIFAFAVWYSARLLTTVDADHATPLALSLNRGSARLAFATTWLPRILGVSALVAEVGALIYANYTPQLNQNPALVLAVLSCAAPLLLAGAYLIRKAGARRSARLPFAIGALLFLVSACLLWTEKDKWQVWIWCLSAAALPALLLVFFVLRRSALGGLFTSSAGDANAARQFGNVIFTTFALMGVGVPALLILAFAPPPLVRGFGSAAAVLMFMAAAVLVLTAIQLILRRIARNVPGLTTACLLVLSVLVATIGKESVGTESLAPPSHPVRLLPPVMPPLANSQNSSRVVPGVYVNAYGGGLRAAAFTAQVLALVDDATCGKFGEQIAAFSGVSGGSLGIGTYLVARQEFVIRDNWSTCQPNATTHRTPLTDIVTRALVQDHLSLAIARMLAVDAPHFPGSPVRGQALLDSWHSALVESLQEGASKDMPPPAALALALGELTGGLAPPPRVYFNATNADTGHIVWFSNRDQGLVGDNGNARGAHAAKGVSVGQAILHSARFPIVSPAGAFPSDPVAPESMRLVDGGYADNSGATTLQLDLRSPGHPSGLPEAMTSLSINGNPPDESICRLSNQVPPILTAVRALLQARSAHAQLAVNQFTVKIQRHPVIQLNLERVYDATSADSLACEKVRRAQQAPLGWYVSYGAAKMLRRSASIGAQTICDTIGLRCRLPTAVMGNE
jgi:predicted acylesterase/phospholipase RssA